MQTLTDAERSRSIPVPRSVAACPICDAEIVVEDIREWTWPEGVPESISVECVTEPDLDADEWPDWHRGHWSTPYIDWLPVEIQVLEWVRANFRCETSDTSTTEGINDGDKSIEAKASQGDARPGRGSDAAAPRPRRADRTDG